VFGTETIMRDGITVIDVYILNGHPVLPQYKQPVVGV
jgi:hypothetical protein